jgi:hypothetical protein
LYKNKYGQKQAGKVWNNYMHAKLVDQLGCTQSLVNHPCFYYFNKTVFLVYVDDGIFGCSNHEKIDKLKKLMTEVFEMMDKKELSDYLGST